MAYSEFKRVAASMMRKFGGNATLIVNGEGVYNDDTQTVVKPLPIEYQVRAIIMDYTLRSMGIGSDFQTQIQSGDKQVFVQPVSNNIPIPVINPTRDFIRIGNDVWKIVTVKDLNPSNTASVLLDLCVRR